MISLTDVNKQEIFKLFPKKTYIYTISKWKWKVVEVVPEKKDFKAAIAELMKDPEMRKHGKEVSRLIQRLIKERAFEVKRIDEEKALREAKDFIEKELGIEIVINPEEDKGGKKKAARPLKPAVYVE
ncbi:Leucyl-tRNA synthetase [Thermococcus sp. 2319x1]|nr:Leucyl-tRNA synthetase [Thermococcus sp. 2319x1]